MTESEDNMKKINEKTVSEDEEIFDRILYYAKKGYWIFISKKLHSRLIHENKTRFNPVGEGLIINIEKSTKKYEVCVEHGTDWYKINSIGEMKGRFFKDIMYFTDDTNYIVFLS